jgi:hypothetical protein
MMIGINTTQVWTVSEVAAGQNIRPGTIGRYVDSEGVKEFMAVLFGTGGATGAGYACLIDADGGSVMASTTTSAPGAGAGKRVGVAMAAATVGQAGWVQIYGNTDLRVAANAALGTILNTTATAGQLDDDATAGAEVIDGITLMVANGGAAGNVEASLDYPSVGRTL